MRYAIVIEKAASTYSVYVPDLPGCVATAATVEAAEEEIGGLELDEVDPDRPLFSGISVTARVDTGYRRTWRHPLQAALAAEAAR